MTHEPQMEQSSFQDLPPSRKHTQLWRNFFFTLFVLLLGCGSYLFYDAYTFLRSPGFIPAKEVVISIPKGATFDRVAWELKKAGAIQDVTRFRLLGKYKDSLGAIKAGDFLVSTGWTPEQVLWQITSGQAILHRLTIREGLTWWETAKAIEEQGFASYEDFKAVIHDPIFLAKNKITAKNAEGFLFPETYLLKKPQNKTRESAEKVAELMVSTFWKKVTPLLSEDTSDFTQTKRNSSQNDTIIANSANGSLKNNGALLPTTNSSQPDKSAKGNTYTSKNTNKIFPLITLASLVEKETGVATERAKVAGVYTNRLERKMRLDCDPTIIYGVGENFKGPIRRSQIQDAANLYNTYQHTGLPPGPICSPGLEAIKAALFPEKHNYIFFVATGVDNSHVFSENLSDHNQAVSQYRFRMRNAETR